MAVRRRFRDFVALAELLKVKQGIRGGGKGAAHYMLSPMQQQRAVLCLCVMLSAWGHCYCDIYNPVKLQQS